jgi:hypothetical protein
MSLAGRLETAELPVLLQTLATNRTTGKLTLTRPDGHALMVFRTGKVIYASSSYLRVPLGTILILRGLITEADLTAALERQHSASHPPRLGSVLVDMHKLEEKTLREVIRQQTEHVFAEVLRWKTGFFEFAPMTVDEEDEIEVDLKDYLLDVGFDPKEVLFRVMAGSEPERTERKPEGKAVDPGTVPLAAHVPKTSGPGGPGTVPLGAILDTPAPAFNSEITLKLMSYAAQILSRGVLFHIAAGRARGIGQFGVTIQGRSAADQITETIIPLREQSLLRDVVERRGTYRGPLAMNRWNAYLVNRLGGQEPAEVIAVPLVLRGAVHGILYGDNLPEQRPVGPIDALEFMVAETAQALERTAGQPPRTNG